MVMRRGDWFATYPTNTQFWPLDPRPHEIFIEDIAHSLARQCRYGGHVAEHYSVAQHSVLVEKVFRADFSDADVLARVTRKNASHAGQASAIACLGALLHDASEAYFPDIIRPIKCSLPPVVKEMVTEIYERLDEAIANALQVPQWLFDCDAVKKADQAVLFAEKRDMRDPPPAPWGPAQGQVANVEPMKDRIDPWPATHAKARFLQRFHELSKEAGLP